MKSEGSKSEPTGQELLRSIGHLDFGIPLAFVIRASSLSNVTLLVGLQARPMPSPESAS